MTELSPEAVALLEEARRSHGPSEHDRTRVLASLHVSLGIAAPLVLATSVAEAASQAASGAGTTTASATSHAVSGVQAAQGALQLGGKTAGFFGRFGSSYASKLLTWKAAKIFLATVALGSAVGVARMQPRRVERRVESDQVDVRTTHALSRPAAREDEPLAGRALEPPELAAQQDPARVARVDEHARAAAVAAHAPALGGPALGAPAPGAPAPGEPSADTLSAPARVAPAAEQVAAAVAAGASALETHPGADQPARSKLGAAVSSRRVSARHRSSSYRTRVHRERVGVEAHARAHESGEDTRASAASAPAAPAHSPAALAAAVQAEVAAPVAPAPSEAELIRKAMTSLRDRDPGRALALLEEHASRYPNGSFATERRGLHAIALCAAGRGSEGRSEQASFLRSDQAAPIAARVRRACVEPKK